MPLMTTAERALLQDMAPGEGDPIGAIHRDTDATPQFPHANSDEFGFSVESDATGVSAEDATGKREVASHPCRVWNAASFRSGYGRRRTAAGQDKVIAPWIVVFNAADNPDVRAGDEIHVDGNGVFFVVDPGGRSSEPILHLVYCESIRP